MSRDSRFSRLGIPDHISVSHTISVSEITLSRGIGPPDTRRPQASVPGPTTPSTPMPSSRSGVSRLPQTQRSGFGRTDESSVSTRALRFAAVRDTVPPLPYLERSNQCRNRKSHKRCSCSKHQAQMMSDDRDGSMSSRADHRYRPSPRVTG